MNKQELTAARQELLKVEIKRQGLTNVANLAGKPARQIKDMAEGRKSFGDGMAREIGPKIRADLPRDWLIYPDLVYIDPTSNSVVIVEVKPSQPGQRQHLLPSSDRPDPSGDGYSVIQKPGLDQLDTDIEIRQFDAGGSMGNGVLLRDQPGVIQSWRVTPEWIQKNVKNHSGTENLCIVTGFGDSMRGMFEPGDPLLVDTGIKAVDFDAIYFFRVDNEGFIKRLQRIPGEGIRAISENKAYESWTIKRDMDFEVFGRVLKAWKSEDY